MATVSDLLFLGAPVDDPVATARFINGLTLTPRQKASTLRDYLNERGILLTDPIRDAAADFVTLV